MFRYLIVLFLILLTDFSFGQIVLTETQSDATIGIDRKAWAGLGNTSGHSDGYAHDFTMPARTNPCQQITDIRVEISLTGYTNNGFCPHFETYYNLFYGCASYSGGATCLPATNLIAEPNYPPNTSPPPFNFGNPLGSPFNPNIVPDFGDNLSIDIIPVSNPGCNAVANGYISHQYTITVTVTITELPPIIPVFTQVSAICSGDTLSTLPATSTNGIPGTWAPALDNTATTTYTFTPDAGQCATSQTMTITVNTPVTPTISCWETAIFNNTTCSWDVSGTQPVQPMLECWEAATFNNTTCLWDVTGSQPSQPSMECWETAAFNNTTCLWEVSGTQPIQPNLECWETATFNNATCSWEVTGSQPTQPNLECWETVTFNNTTCLWEVSGTQPIQPNLECWEATTFNNASCTWEVSGTQPMQPNTACWETALFNDTTCVWEVSGTQPIQPSIECWETATFNNGTCLWDITGTQPGNVFEENIDLCANENETLQAQTSISNPSYLWNTGEIADSIVIANAGEYNVEITGGVCSFETRIFNVIDLAAPIIDSVISDGRHLIINTSNTGDFLYSLDGNTFQPSNTFFNVEGGFYTIEVKQRNCDSVVFYEHLHFFIPKYFTPNNDGVNDTFDLDGIQFYGSSLVSIYNRYGKLMKFSKNGLFSWDGTFNGEFLPSDDYWYVIIIDGQKFSGHFTLKR